MHILLQSREMGWHGIGTDEMEMIPLEFSLSMEDMESRKTLSDNYVVISASQHPLLLLRTKYMRCQQ